jgi:putative DNA primase/helicase
MNGNEKRFNEAFGDDYDKIIEETLGEEPEEEIDFDKLVEESKVKKSKPFKAVKVEPVEIKKEHILKVVRENPNIPELKLITELFKISYGGNLEIGEDIQREFRKKALNEIAKLVGIKIHLVGDKYILIDRTKEVKPLTELEGFIKSYSDKLDMAEQFYLRLPFCYDRNKMWWLWNNTRKCWELTDEVDLLNSIDNALNTSDNTIRSDVKNEIIEAMRRVGRKHQPKPIKETWVQFNNSIVDVTTGENIEPTPEYFAVNPIAWNLGDKEDTPTIDKIFNEWVSSDNVPKLYEEVSYCLLPDYPINRLFCHVGAGNNGKTCFNNLIIKLVGKENVSSVDLDLLQSSRFESSKIYKKLVAFVSETNFATIRKSDKLKKLCGKDLIDFEFKGKLGFSDWNYAKLFINTNALPLTNDRTRGFYRRWLTTDFPNEFTEAVDVLSSIPDQEYSNLARKCVRILTQLLKDRKFTNEGTIEDRERRYEELSNPIVKFIDLTYEKDVDGKVLFSEFRDSFLVWLKENKLRVVSSKELSFILAREGYQTKKTHGSAEETPKFYILGLKNKGENEVCDTDDINDTDTITQFLI